jgi:hypothetical protein
VVVLSVTVTGGGAGRCGVGSDRWGERVNPVEAVVGAAGFSARVNPGAQRFGIDLRRAENLAWPAQPGAGVG